MSDVVAVGLITAASTLIGSGIGAFTTYKVTKRNAETTVKTAEQQTDAELQKVKAKSERLRMQHRENERRNRQGTYHRMVTYFGALDTWARDPQATAEQFRELSNEFDYPQGGV